VKRAAGAGRPRHWAQINEAGFVAGMRLLFWICRTFGRWPFRVALYPVLAWYVLTQPRARAASLRYLRLVRAAGAQVAIGWPGVLWHFAAFGECILDKLLLWGGLFDTTHTSLHGAEALDADLAQGRGGLMICSHFGNLELCRVLARRHPGLRLTVLVHTMHARKFNQLLAQLDPQSQLDLVQVTEISPATVMLLNDRVARGEFVVIAGDRVPVNSGERTCTASFLGAPAPFAIGPWVLASVLQCPVYVLFALRTAEGAEVHFERIAERVRLPRQGREAACAVLAQTYAARLEQFCLRAPYQWFNFHDFWQPACGQQP
jgi:predicted LPLAT superfamily acyltransferase